jgi:hypothetical protein
VTGWWRAAGRRGRARAQDLILDVDIKTVEASAIFSADGRRRHRFHPLAIRVRRGTEMLTLTARRSRPAAESAAAFCQ